MSLSDTFGILQHMIIRMASSDNGISTAEIADTYNISQRVVLKYIEILEINGIPIYEDKQRYYLDEGYHTAFTLTSDESEFLYILLERSLVLHSEHWATMQSLLKKLGNKMTQPLSDYLIQQLDTDRGELLSDRHFKLLSEAKRKRYEARVEYHPLRREKTSVWFIRPYRFTSNYFSDGLYVMCYGSRDGNEYVPLALRFDRIMSVNLTRSRFSIVDLAHAANTPKSPWGVWNSEREPTEVHLRFEPRHYDRLLETTWHRSQVIQVDKDGYVNFSVLISEPDEIVPWIRSWGSGVVIVSPEQLRKRIINTIRRQAIAYGVDIGSTSSTENAMQFLWAKYRRSDGQYHLLIYHLLDVAAVAYQMWDYALSEIQQQWLASVIALPVEQTRRLIAFYVGLHDIGKATPDFQSKAPSIYEMLLSTGIPDQAITGKAHGILSAVILNGLINNMGDDLDPDSVKDLALAIGGHHGHWVSHIDYKNARGSVGKEQWEQLQRSIFNVMRDVLNITEITVPNEIRENNIFTTFISGFTSVCDWIGSDETFFTYEQVKIDPDEYFEEGLERAGNAIHELGWVGWQADGQIHPFNTLFPFPPKPMQQAILNEIGQPDQMPRMILIEYLTGGGKTEIALALADILMNLFALRGMYVAMPTQATSNQMFDRISDYLMGRYENDAINLHLIHSQSQHQPRYSDLILQTHREGDESRLVAEVWFQNRRRALLAPFAVGTIDQAMLSVLQTRHHFVRQFGLSNKVIIFDEIHAYDTFMNQVIEHLMHWLYVLGSPLILLSATLPMRTKKQLFKQVEAHGKLDEDVPYPRLTIINGHGGIITKPLPSPNSYDIHLDWLNPDDFVQWMSRAYTIGGCIAVICNTVNAAIDTAKQLREASTIEADDVMLLHARMPFAWRNAVEADVLQYFGKTGERPDRKILVATQIIEQSLDLDFDMMVTSVAPVDLLIQRAGRLHRHQRQRPNHALKRTLHILQPDMNSEAVPSFGVDELIYEQYPLLRTWQILRERDVMTIPNDIDRVIEAVYQEENIHTYDATNPIEHALADAHDSLTMREHGQGYRGKQFLIGQPTNESLIGRDGAKLPDDETIVSTRDMQRGIDIICMSEDGYLGLPTWTERPPTKAQVNILLQYRITIRNQSIVDALLALPPRPEWQREPSLRDARPMIFAGDGIVIAGSKYQLQIDPFYGLELIQEDA